MTLEERIELESALLGWMMAENHAITAIGGLVPELFVSRPHIDICRAIIARVESGEPANPITIASLVTLPDDADPKVYLVQCFSKALQVVFPREYIKLLRKEQQRDEVLALCERVKAKAGEQEPEEVTEAMLSGVEAILRQTSGISISNSFDVAVSIIESMKELPPNYSTGLPKLDAAMDGGLYAGKSYGFGGRKKTGKTIIASTISSNLEDAGVPHLCIWGEMGREEVYQRTLARKAGVYPSVFRDRSKATPQIMTQIAQAAMTINRCAFHMNAPGLTFDELKRTLGIAVYRHGIKGFILDYWQLVGGKGKGQSTSEHLDEVAQWIADFCRKHGLWSLTMAQINQEGNTRGGEGMRLAFDQVYHLQAVNDDVTAPGRWLEMLDTRYTSWCNIGSADTAGLWIEPMGPYFAEVS